MQGAVKRPLPFQSPMRSTVCARAAGERSGIIGLSSGRQTRRRSPDRRSLRATASQTSFGLSNRAKGWALAGMADSKDNMASL
jgi:hypothetical protein